MADTPTDLFSQQETNRRRSRLLVLFFILFFAWLGFGGDYIGYELTRGAEAGTYRHGFPWFGIVMTALAGGMAAFAWKTGPERVLWSSNAKELLEPQTPEQLQLVNVVEEMAIASGLPKPRIWVIADTDPNAFATGHDANRAHIAVTEGLLTVLSRDELQAVIAHELGHVKNLDVRLMTLLAALVGAVALISDGMGRVLRGGVRVGGRSGRRSSRKGGGLGPVMVAVIALWLISWLLAPLVTRLLALGVSRKREFLADAMSAQFTRNPLALATALEKIEHAEAPTGSIKRGSAHLCIADPLGRKSSLKEGKLADWFGTHPPMPLRVAKLKAMGYQEQKRLGTFDAGVKQGA